MEGKHEARDTKINNKLSEGEGVRYSAGADKRAAKHSPASSQKRRAFPRKKPYIVALLLMGVAAIGFLVMLIVLNTFPPDLTILMIVVMMALLLITCFLFASRYRWKRVIGIFVALIFVAGLVSLTGFMGSTYAMLNKVSGGATDASGPSSKGVAITEEPFNIYITGIDQWEEEKGLDLERSDVNMIVTVNPRTKKVLLTSIPRDSYIKLHTAQQMDKLTHTGVYGVEETLSTVEDWMGIDINYYVKMNFTAVRDIINAMGGIRVYSPVEFDSSLKGYHYKKGWNDLGGREALYFARERHAFEGQDSIRVENQQRVMKAIIKKMTSSTALLTNYGKVLDAAGNNLSTNMSADEMKELVKMQLAELANWDIQSQKLKGDYDMDYVASLSSKNKYSVYRVDEDSLNKCIKAINEIENPSEEELKAADETRSKSFLVNLARNVKDKVTRSESEEE